MDFVLLVLLSLSKRFFCRKFDIFYFGKNANSKWRAGGIFDGLNLKWGGGRFEEKFLKSKSPQITKLIVSKESPSNPKRMNIKKPQTPSPFTTSNS